MQHLAIVWNPVKVERATLERALDAVGHDADLEVSWWETSEDDAGQGMTGDALAAGADAIAAVGGDGTVRAVAERLADAQADSGDSPLLAIVPRGTGNLLARNLGVPLDDPRAAFARLLAPERRRIDVGWLHMENDGTQERHGFAVLAGFGIDAHMIAETDERLKKRLGWLAYVESLGRAMAASAPVDLTLAVDDVAAEQSRGHTLLIGNCGMLQGGATLLPDADPSDGELDLLFLTADGAAEWLDTVRSVIWENGIRRLWRKDDRASTSPTARYARARTVRVELSEPRTVQIDGETIGDAQRIEVRIQPGALLVA